MGDNVSGLTLAPQNLRFQKASSVAQVAEMQYNRGETVKAATLMPHYLRLSQAERELIAKIRRQLRMIALGCDHGGYAIKEAVKKYLEENSIEFKDFGCYSEESVDYPIYAKR